MEDDSRITCTASVVGHMMWRATLKSIECQTETKILFRVIMIRIMHKMQIMSNVKVITILKNIMRII